MKSKLNFAEKCNNARMLQVKKGWEAYRANKEISATEENKRAFKVGDKVGFFIPGKVIGLRKSGHALIEYASTTLPMKRSREWIHPNGSRWKGEAPTVFHLEDIKDMKITEG